MQRPLTPTSPLSSALRPPPSMAGCTTARISSCVRFRFTLAAWQRTSSRDRSSIRAMMCAWVRWTGSAGRSWATEHGSMSCRAGSVAPMSCSSGWRWAFRGRPSAGRCTNGSWTCRACSPSTAPAKHCRTPFSTRRDSSLRALRRRARRGVHDGRSVPLPRRAGQVAWHGDRIGRGAREDTMVAILSVGAPRDLLLRPRRGGEAVRRPSDTAT